MSHRDADRAQSIQIGAVLLFGILVMLLASYQAVVVPNQNRQVEATHVSTISGEMQDLRNAFVSVPSTAAGRSISLTLGVEYPPRVVAVNPPAPAGAIRTLETVPDQVNVTVANALATDDEVDDYWTGTDRTVNSGGVAYQPGYNEYRNPPTIVYENSLLYHQFGSRDLTRAGQRLVDGRELSLLAVNGSLDRSTSDSVTVDLDAVSASDRRISITDDGTGPLVVNVASQYGADQWEQLLREDGQFTGSGGYVTDVTESPIPGSSFNVVHVELAQDYTYTLQMAKVGIGTGVVDEQKQYLVDVAGDGRTITEESTTQIVLEARDGLNNPVPSVEVHGRVEPGPQNGDLADTTVETDKDGRAVFEYQADEIDGTPTRAPRIEFSYLGQPDGSFDADTSQNVSVGVTVENTGGGGGGGNGGGGGPFAVEWADPSGQPGVDCSTDPCTFDGSELSLTAETTPSATGVEVDFSVNDSTIVTPSPGEATTNGDGEASTLLDVTQSGAVTVFVTGGGGDAIEFLLTVAGGLVYNDDAVAETPQIDPGGTQSQVSFSVTNQYSGEVTLTGFTLNSTSVPPSASIREDSLGDNHEVWIDTDGDGDSEGNYDATLGEISEGKTVGLDEDADLDPGSTADVRLYQFRRSASGNPFNVGNQDVTVALHFEDDAGTRQTLTIPMEDLPT